MNATTRVVSRVEGMDCASCVAKVTQAVERLPGVSGIEVNLVGERLALDLAPGGAGPDAVARQVRALGYGVRPIEPAPGAAAGAHGHGHDDPAEAGGPWWTTGKARLV